jgi:hypothetical protein
MNREHIVVLKKIPVNERHVESLRIGRETSVTDELPTPTYNNRTPLPYKIFSSILFAAFLINPIGVAYAEEVTPLPPVEAVEESPAEEVPAIEPGVTIVEPPVDQSHPIDSSPEDSQPAAQEEATTTTEVSTTTDGVIGGGVPQDEHASTTEDSATSTDTQASSTEEIIVGEDLGSSTPTSTDEILDETSTTTEETVEPEAPPETILEREQTPEERAAEKIAAEAAMREQIKKEVAAELRSQCVSYGDDGYYCLDESSEKKISVSRPTQRVVAELAGGGDKEIILVETYPEGETRKALTENDIDDDFPNADAGMHMIVWQSLVNGRWQIVYKEGTATPEYLTSNPDGNGHPATDGKRIVWQGWNEDQWDIFLAEPGEQKDLSSTSTQSLISGLHPGWSVRRLSDNLAHDMFPKIAGNFVTWQERQDDRWLVAVYDLSTGQIRHVEGGEGGGEAPTVALIFKERTKDGQIFIRASDLMTGERIPLRDDEVPPPATLPIPEQNAALPLQGGTSTVTSLRSEGDGGASDI